VGPRDGLLEHGMGMGVAFGRGGTDAGWDAVRDNVQELRPDALFVRTFGR
jgi:hypothetical protein